MSKKGLDVAEEYGMGLLSFKSLNEALDYYQVYRDKHLSLLRTISNKQNKFILNYNVDSLKSLESWYFDNYENDTFEAYGVDSATFEKGMAMYFGEVVVKNNSDAEWIVEESVFSPGKYKVGIKKGLATIMIERFTDHYKEPNNKRKQFIYRLYKKHFA